MTATASPADAALKALDEALDLLGNVEFDSLMPADRAVLKVVRARVEDAAGALRPRLLGGSLMDRVLECLTGDRWWTLAALAQAAGASEASVSARIRDLRKAKYGGHEVERRRVDGAGNVWEYRIV